MPGVNWTLNMSGRTLTEEQMQDIPFPRLEMVTHITMKTVQMGGLIGTTMVAPAMAYKHGETNFQGMSKWVQNCGTRGVQIGLIAGPLLTFAAMKAQNLGKDAMWDLSYRVRFNRNQRRVDQMVLVGIGAGTGAALYYGQDAAFGALAGMSGGFLSAMFYNYVLP